MSHFALLVITPTLPTDAELSAVLQPFHEYECTGTEDQYVIDVDKTEEAMKAWREATEVRVKAPDGTLHNRFTPEGNWDPRFSKVNPDAPSYRPDERIEFIPPGHERVELPASEVEAACDWISDYYGWPIAGEAEVGKYGYIQIDADRNVVKCIDRTNPNAKWDWWVVGGRYSARLKVKPGAASRSGERSWANDLKPGQPDPAAEGWVDSVALGDLDLEAMRQKKRQEGEALWDKVHPVAVLHPQPETWEQVVERLDKDYTAAREFYHAQPLIQAIRAAFPQAWDIDDELEAARHTREAYSDRCADRALSAFAVLRDGLWAERGDMGWFGCVADEKDPDTWQAEFAKMIDGLPPETGLTFIDCHI